MWCSVFARNFQVLLRMWCQETGNIDSWMYFCNIFCGNLDAMESSRCFCSFWRTWVEPQCYYYHQDLRPGNRVTPKKGDIVVVDWDGYTIGYYGRIFEARNKTKGGSFEPPVLLYLLQYLNSKRMDVYEPMHQFCMWGDFKGNIYQDASATMILEVDAKLDNQSEDPSHTTNGPSNHCDQEPSKGGDKVLRRLAQNREAARKIRLRKKAYVQQLEASDSRIWL